MNAKNNEPSRRLAPRVPFQNTPSLPNNITAKHKPTLFDSLVHILTSPLRFFKALCFGVGLFFLISGSIFAIAAYLFFASIPSFETVSFSQMISRAKKNVVASLEKKSSYYAWVDISNISRDLIYATVQSEDGLFFEHDGINYDAILRALAQNWKAKKIASGASTITQQVAKNLFLTDDKSLERKLREIIISKRLEERFSKNEILELYLNVAEYGPDIFGISAASRYYFHKRPSQLKAHEAAFLSLMLPSPRKNHYSIFIKQNLTLRRLKKLRTILKGMLYKEYITQSEYKKYIKHQYFAKIPAKNSKR